jgi:hypothetical protein
LQDLCKPIIVEKFDQVAIMECNPITNVDALVL